MKLIQKLVLGAAATLLSVGASAADKSPISGNVALTTDYAFRGISQTSEEPAIQGGFGYTHSSGVYASIWGSNVNFGDGDEAQLEIDYVAGISGKFGTSKLGWDVGFIHYDYPGANGSLNYDFTEIFGKLSYDFGAATGAVGLNATDEFFGKSGDATYLAVDVSVPLPGGFGLNLHIGKQDIDKNENFANIPDYKDYKIGISKEFAGLGFALDFVDTDLSKTECGGADTCESRVIFTVSKSM